MPYASLVLLLTPRQGGNPAFIMVAQFVLIGAIVYFLLFRPQRKEQQRHQEMLTQLKKGDEIVTAGGIIGTIVHVEEDRITIRSGDTTRLVVERGRISRVTSQKETKDQKE